MTKNKGRTEIYFYSCLDDDTNSFLPNSLTNDILDARNLLNNFSISQEYENVYLYFDH